MANSQENTIILSSDQTDPKSAASAHERSTRFDGIAVTLGGAALIALVSFILFDISPFIVAFVLFLLLFPFREYRAARTIMFTAGILLGFWLIITLASLLLPFILGLLIAYLFDPVVTQIEKSWKISRAWSSILIVIVICGVVVLAGLLFIPLAISQLEALLTRISSYLQNSTVTFDEQGIRNFFLSIGLPQKYIDQYVTGEIVPQINAMYAKIPHIITFLLGAIPGYAARIFDLIIIPIAAIYFLKDWDTMIESIQSLIPQRHRPAFIATFVNIDKVLYGYIRGQSTVAVIIGGLGAIIFLILGVPYAALLGLSIAILDLIPILGLFVSIIIIEVVIVLTMPLTVGSVLIGLIVIAALHLFENYYLGPKIVGKGVGIPPILIIMSIFIFGYFLGFVGILLAVPLTGIILLFVREYRQALIDHPLL